MQIRSQHSNKKLVFLLMVFILPMMASTLLYYLHSHFNFKTTNHGVLVKQPLDAQYLYSAMPGGKEKKWRVLYVDKGVCNNSCEKVNYELHQIQKALGKDGGRIQVVALSGKRAELTKLQQAFSQQNHSEFAVNDKIYLIDPLGNLFMFYPGDTNPMNVLKDLKKVLEVSQIG